MGFSGRCKNCGKRLYSGNKSGYCIDCMKKCRDEEKINHWLETGDTGCSVASTLRNCIRDYIMDRQDHKCSICHNDNVWQGKELKFILDHIDGDASNNWESNLRLICPNCDSQLDTYKSKNKNSARKFRR